ncbi:MAG TPA: hypothetical protein VGP68_24950 [Gemmataceae bacterium]|nr:hypothetical protein [Gemmataceae bacterium]
MIDSQTCQIIQQILHDESRTLLQYACEAFPRFSAADKSELALLQARADQELAAARAAAVWLSRQGKQPLPMDPYPAWYLQINFISVAFLLPQLEKEHRAAIDRLTAALGRLTNPEAKSLVQAILVQKQMTLALLTKQDTPALAGAGH